MQIYAASYLLPINSPPIEGGAIAVENGIIRAVGYLSELRKKYSVPVHEFPGGVLLPGLVNAHTHLELTHFPEWLLKNSFDITNGSYVDWIMQVIKVKRLVGVEELTASLLQGLDRSLQSGTTMVGDILSERRLIPIYGDTPLTGRVFLEFIGQDRCRFSPFLDSLDNDLDSVRSNFLPGLAPHSPFTVSSGLLKSLLSFARRRNIPVTMHLSESDDESSFFSSATGRIAQELYPFVGWGAYLSEPLGITSTEWLDSAGALAPDFLAVHGVHLSPVDIEMIKQRGGSVVLVPRSNNYLDVGKAPVEELLQADVPLSLGTDSLASNDSLSLWDEMKFLLDAFPRSFSPEDALRMATMGGAKALKRYRESGSLETGKRADFIVMTIGNLTASRKIYERLIEDSKLLGVWCGGERMSPSEC